MGQSTDGQICYDILFDDGVEFPWDSDEHAGDIDDWWVYSVLGFCHSFELYVSGKGVYIGGHRPTKERISQYWGEYHEFLKINPVPVELVNYCSGDFPMYILAIPETCKAARRGHPEKFDPSELVVTARQIEVLLDFCKTHAIEFEGDPAWYLSSYWG